MLLFAASVRIRSMRYYLNWKTLKPCGKRQPYTLLTVTGKTNILLCNETAFWCVEAVVSPSAFRVSYLSLLPRLWIQSLLIPVPWAREGLCGMRWVVEPQCSLPSQPSPSHGLEWWFWPGTGTLYRLFATLSREDLGSESWPSEIRASWNC